MSREDPVSISPSIFDEPFFDVHYGRGRLHIAGTSVSSQHEAELRQLAADFFPHADVSSEFNPALGVSPDWEDISARLLYLLASTESAHAELQAGQLRVRAVSKDRNAFEKQHALLNAALADNFLADAQLIQVDNSDSLPALCRRNFDSFAHQSILFAQSSISPRPSSAPLLDQLAEFAYDCRIARLALVGHSDAIGNEAWNTRISRARAEAVAAELKRRGIPAQQLIIEARGALQPVADNNSVAGRERNRRVDFELRCCSLPTGTLANPGSEDRTAQPQIPALPRVE